MKKTFILLTFVVSIFWFYTLAINQTDPILQQAIRVVREWLNDPQAEIEFIFHNNTSLGLSGPRNEFCFKYGIYEIIVNINEMKITGWSIDLVDWANQVHIDLLEKNETEVLNIAYNYVIHHFPYFNKFPEWKKTIIPNFVKTFQEKEVVEYIVSFIPYIKNELNVKIPVLTTICSVEVDPYEGKIIGFYQKYIPMTLTNLTPNLSIEEAKTRMEQAFLELGAAQATAIIPSTDEYHEFGLVIGATQTSGLRLAYSGGVETIGAPGYEEKFGTPEEPQVWYAAIDAHTGELFYFEKLGEMGIVEQNLLIGKQPMGRQLKFYKWQSALLPFLVGGLVGVLIIFLMCVFFGGRKNDAI